MICSNLLIIFGFFVFCVVLPFYSAD
jgi:hypothetical protein